MKKRQILIFGVKGIMPVIVIGVIFLLGQMMKMKIMMAVVVIPLILFA